KHVREQLKSGREISHRSPELAEQQTSQRKALFWMTRINIVEMAQPIVGIAGGE
ncbi:4578_t:CDS:2, partial [Racocetra persica]